MSNNRFCPKCGQPIGDGTRFCGNCGAPLNVSPGPPSPYPPTAPTSYPPPYPSATPPTYQPTYQPTMPPGNPVQGRQPQGASPGAAQRKNQAAKKKRKPPFIVFLIAILLIVFALAPPFLLIAGTSTQGTVTKTNQVVNANSNRMDRNYEISYRFMDGDGKTVNASYRMNRVHNISKLPRVGSSLKVRYFPAFSRINMPDNPGSLLGSLAAGGLGVGLLVFSRGVKIGGKKR